MSKQIRISDELVERIEKEGKLKMSDTYSTVLLRLIAHEDEMRECKECKRKDKIIADFRLDQDPESQLEVVEEVEEPEPEPEPKDVPISVYNVNKVKKINKPKPEPAKVVKNVEPEPLSEQEKRTKIIEIIRAATGIYGGPSAFIDIATKAKRIGIELDELKEILDWLLKKDRIDEPSMGSYRVIEADQQPCEVVNRT